MYVQNFYNCCCTLHNAGTSDDECLSDPDPEGAGARHALVADSRARVTALLATRTVTRAGEASMGLTVSLERLQQAGLTPQQLRMVMGPGAVLPPAVPRPHGRALPNQLLPDDDDEADLPPSLVDMPAAAAARDRRQAGQQQIVAEAARNSARTGATRWVLWVLGCVFRGTLCRHHCSGRCATAVLLHCRMLFVCRC